MFVNTNASVCVFVCQRVVNGPGAPTMTGTPLTSDYGRKEPVPHHLPFPGSLPLLLSSLLVLSVGPFSVWKFLFVPQKQLDRGGGHCRSWALLHVLHSCSCNKHTDSSFSTETQDLFVGQLNLQIDECLVSSVQFHNNRSYKFVERRQ